MELDQRGNIQRQNGTCSETRSSGGGKSLEACGAPTPCNMQTMQTAASPTQGLSVLEIIAYNIVYVLCSMIIDLLIFHKVLYVTEINKSHFLKIEVWFDLRSLFYDDLDHWWTSIHVDMNVKEHSSVNGSMKIDEAKGYQKLPTDQEIHVIESKKSR